MTPESPELIALRQRLEEEEAAYAELLAAIDRLVQFPLPIEQLPAQPALMERLNTLWQSPPAPALRSRLLGRFWSRIWAALAPHFQRQQDFNSVLVQVLNGHLDGTGRLHADLRELATTLVRYFQKLLPVIDARDRLASGLTTTRAELILEVLDRRQEMLARRLDGLLAMRDRLETLSQEARSLRDSLAAVAPPRALAAAAVSAAEDAAYVAFENRYRGSREEVRARLTGYVELFRGLAPIADLGCGRGEFLELLREAGLAARGVDSNASAVAECVGRGLDVVHGDLIEFVHGVPAAGLGGLFASQVAEHLPPRLLLLLLREAHRVLRRDGLLVLETVNPRSVIGFVDVYTRDITHERPLHPDTLRFLAAASGFTDVRVEWRSPVDPAAQLQRIPPDGLPETAAQLLNENVERLNGLLYAPQEYALLARR